MDSEERTGALESLRARGADWLLVPYWYADWRNEPILANYVGVYYSVAYESDAGFIFRAR